jgi:hypothetical protein
VPKIRAAARDRSRSLNAGINLEQLAGSFLAELIQNRPAPVDLDLQAFDPDRFGGWDHAE